MSGNNLGLGGGARHCPPQRGRQDGKDGGARIAGHGAGHEAAAGRGVEAVEGDGEEDGGVAAAGGGGPGGTHAGSANEMHAKRGSAKHMGVARVHNWLRFENPWAPHPPSLAQDPRGGEEGTPRGGQKRNQSKTLEEAQ